MKTFNFSDENELALYIEKVSYEELDIRDDEGNTILHKAIELGDILLIEIILDSGIDVNIRNNKGNTAAHLAAMFDDDYALEFLMNYGCDLSIRNNNQRSIGDIAKMSKSQRVEKFLKDYSDDRGYTVKINSYRGCDDEY